MSVRFAVLVFPLTLCSCALPSAFADPIDAATPDATPSDATPDVIRDVAPDATTLDAPLRDAASDASDAHDAPAVPPPEAVVTVTPTAPPELPQRVVDYTLRATLDANAHTVAGEGTVRWTNPARVPTRELWLHLYLNAFRGPDTYFMRGWGPLDETPSQWGRIELQALRLASGEDLLATASRPPEPADDETQLRVILPREVAPGETVSLSMRWRSVLPQVIARTGFRDRFHMVAQWFPKLAVLEGDGRWASFPFHAHSEFYADFGRYDVTLDVPRGYAVGATGQREGAVVPQGARDVHRFVADRVHDFAWTAWDGFRTRDARVGDVALRVMHPPGAERDAQRIVELAQGMVPAFARRFGPYPYPNLTVVLPPRGAEQAGGMEYPTLITTVGAWWAPRRLRFLEYVTVHEFGHQYFYGIFASDEHRWPFLDEGFCEYATARVMEDLYGPGGPVVDLPWLMPRIDTWAWEAAGSASISAPVPVATAASVFATQGRYGSHVYPRTAAILRTLERSFGRERFGAAMRAYADDARFRHPTPDTVYDAFTRTLGEEPVSGFLRPALEAPFQVDLRVALAESARGRDGLHRGRVVVDRVGGPALPVDVEMESEDGQRTRVRWETNEGTAVFRYTGRSPLRAARIDPDTRIPLDRNRVDNARVASGEERSAAPLVARVAWWLGLVMDMVGP